MAAVMERIQSIVYTVNGAVGKSTFGRFFRLEGCGHVCLFVSFNTRYDPLTHVPDRTKRSQTRIS